MYHYSHRTDSPLSYTSITPTGTPELCGLSPTPRPKLRITSTGFPYDQGVALYRQPQRRSQHVTTTPASTPSTTGGSTSSRATFWSAVDSVELDLEEEEDCNFEPGSKADSGILVSPILPPSPRGRRESTSSGSTGTPPSSRSTATTHKSHPKSTQSSTQSSRATRPRYPSRQSTITSNWTSSSSSTAVPPKLSRTSTESTLRSPPPVHTKASRAEIATSLQQKYPNDRCHGAFLPFRSEFSHSKDSLCPVRFLSSNAPGTPSTQTSSPVPTPPTPMSEAYNGPVMYNTPIDWKGNEARRREYEAADRRKHGWRKWCCGVFGRSGDKVFWDGDDGGSVRRYRLDLPPESPEEEAPVVEKLSIEAERSVGTVVVRKEVRKEVDAERPSKEERRERRRRRERGGPRSV